MKKTIGHRQISQSININLSFKTQSEAHIAIKPEIFLVVPGKSARNCMIVVDDRSHCIKSESVNVIDLHKIQQLTQKELGDLDIISSDQKTNFAFSIIEAL